MQLGSILSWVSETPHPKSWRQVTHSPRPFGLACHKNSVTTDSHAPCDVLRYLSHGGDAPQFIISSHYTPPGPGPTMGASTFSLPSDSPLRCLLNNLDTLGLTPDIKPKNLICFCTQIWPTYPLDNRSHWSFFGSLDPSLLRDLYNYCERSG
jgi:hypothetical protein